MRDIDIEDVKVNRHASQIIDRIWSMGILGLPKVWIFEGDDSPEHYATVESLVDYVKDYGGKVLKLSGDNIELMNGKNTCSGRILVQVD